jgi:hypothetical protein
MKIKSSLDVDVSENLTKLLLNGFGKSSMELLELDP